MTTLFHPLRVRRIDDDTQEAKIVSFDVPPGLRETFGFTQGQYLTLRHTVDGQELRRSYSICAGVDDGELRVGVRKVQGGAFSNWIHSQLQVGDTLQVMAPQGRFFVPIEPNAKRHFLGIAGGSGITPILSIMKTVLAREPGSRFTLIYGNRRLQSTMFKEELEDLKNRYMTRVNLQHVFSDEATDAPLNSGVMNRERISEFLQDRSSAGPSQVAELPLGEADAAQQRPRGRAIIPAESIDHAFICGPFQMNEEAEAALRAAGVPEDRIHIERFGVAPGSPAAGGAVLHQALPGDADVSTITIIRDGLSREVTFRKDQPSILDCASAAGLEMPFSCTSGVCGTCRAKVLAGEVRMARNFALDKQDVANGFVLCCQAHPLSAAVTLSFDAR